MIKDPLSIVTVLLLIEGLIFFLAEESRTKWFFNFLPPMFWIYFLPMLATTAGILPAESDAYSFITKNLLPASLILLLLSVDLRQIARLGKPALLMMLAGSLGIVVGGPAALILFQPWLPEGVWSGFGALSGSWIGGSANMVAVKEGLGTPQAIFTPMIVVDTVVAYSWMGLLIALVRFQNVFDRWNGSDTRVMDDLNRKMAVAEKQRSEPLTLKYAVLIFMVGFVGTFIAWKVGGKLPEVKKLVSAYTWTIVVVSTLGIGLSFTPIRKLETYGASRIGYGLLYFVLASIGAKASLADIFAAPVLILAGVVWVLIHGLILLAASRLLRAPMFLAVTASQANIGGPASAPVVAGIYQPALASVGLLLAIVGNIMGTYLGILCGQLCRMVSR